MTDRKGAAKGRLSVQRDALNRELASLKGMFTGKRRKAIEEQLAELEAELKKLS